MAFHNTNYSFLNLTGAKDLADAGFNGTTATTVHEVYCTVGGSIELSAIGGGKATFTMAAGQSVKMTVGSYAVSSGKFIGFRIKGDKPGFDQNTVEFPN